jgi:hypothetical protein
VRIAISGTHCSGKTTLVEDFLAVHPEFIHEPEPYEWLEDVYGEGMTDEPTADDFLRQLELSVERLRTYSDGAKVLAERSPADFLAYMLALGDLGRARYGSELIPSAVELAATGIAHLDLIVVLPLNLREGIAAPESEDLELREAANDRLLDLVNADEYGLFTGSSPRIVEIQGTRDERLRAMERAVFHRATHALV